jgi:hypothetical protein
MSPTSPDSNRSKPRSPRPLPAFYREYQAKMAARELAPPPSRENNSIAPGWRQLAVRYLHRLRDWMTGPDGRACGASLLFHLSLLTILSLFAMSHGAGAGSGGVLLRQGESDADRVALENLLEGEQVSAGGASNLSSSTFLAAPLSGAVPEAEPIRPEVDLQSTIAGLELSSIDVGAPSDLTQNIEELTGTGKGRGKGSGVGNLTEGFAKPGNGRIVRKGKFAAWTVPSDPRPRQDYLIVIEVEYPKTKEKKLLRNRRNDLSGTVEGTDSYFQIIERSGYFIPKSNQMVIPVPGGEMNVRDVIHVRSKMLEESQELTIVF